MLFYKKWIIVDGLVVWLFSGYLENYIFDISDKVMGVNVYKVFNKRSKKKNF